MPRILLAVLACVLISAAHAGEAPTIKDILDRIQAKYGAEWNKVTVDTVKAGDTSKPCTGITLTMFPTLDLLKKSVAEKNNLIICHEPCFYNHKDELTPLEDDEVQKAKLKFITDNGLVVFRFHDHSHRLKPDAILTGMVELFGWEKYLRAGQKNVYTIPETTLGDLAADLKQKSKSSAVRVVGPKDFKCSKIALLPGAAGSNTQEQLLQRDDIEVLVIGETREWETVEYVRDAISAGKKKALIILGHNVSEEAGMNYCMRWLKEFITDVPMKFIESGDPFWAP